MARFVGARGQRVRMSGGPPGDAYEDESGTVGRMPLSTVIIVSPHFPPSTLAGVHRARHLAKHLPSHGWRPIVVRVDAKHYTELPDPTLATLVPAYVEQIYTTAVPARVARFLGVGDIGLRAYRALENALNTAIEVHAPRAVLITGSPFYPMLMAHDIKRRWRVPVVLDFQDPWVSAAHRRKAPGSKAWAAQQLAHALEPRAVRGASWITSVSDTQNAEMAERYAWLDASRMSAIPIGGDPDDYVAMRAMPAGGAGVWLDPSLVNLCYVGTFLPRAIPVVRALFEALSLLRTNQPDIANKLRLRFIGTSNQPSATMKNAQLVTPLAIAAGVEDLVQEHARRVPYLDALSLQANAHCLLLLGSDEPHYTASKIYPALMSGRPYLSIFHERSSSHAILTQASGGATFAFDNVGDLAKLVPAIAAALAGFAKATHRYKPAQTSSYALYTADAIAALFAGVFDRIVTGSDCGEGRLLLSGGLI